MAYFKVFDKQNTMPRMKKLLKSLFVLGKVVSLHRPNQASRSRERNAKHPRRSCARPHSWWPSTNSTGVFFAFTLPPYLSCASPDVPFRREALPGLVRGRRGRAPARSVRDISSRRSQSVSRRLTINGLLIYYYRHSIALTISKLQAVFVPLREQYCAT